MYVKIHAKYGYVSILCGENNNVRHLLCAASEMGKNNMGEIGRKKTLPSSEVKEFFYKPTRRKCTNNIKMS
jgi:hypothetical protein